MLAKEEMVIVEDHSNYIQLSILMLNVNVFNNSCSL